MRFAPRRLSFLGFGALALAAAGAIALARPFSDGARATGGAATWKEVERLVSEQKLEEASERVAKIRQAARAEGDETNEAKALVREVQLRTALHGYETSVRFLKDQPWPKGLLPRTALRLFYAQSLVTYTGAYAWEIGRRERVASTGAVDLKAWTREEIAAEAVRTYVEVFRDRESLGDAKVAALDEFLVPNNYPKGIRDTLRDATAYLFVALLSDSTFWRPEQSNGVFALDRASLVAGDSAASRLVALEDPSVHPLLKLGAVLDDLETWHAERGEREAALEARLERVRRLHAAMTDASDRSLIRRDLARRLVDVADVPWWAMGKAELAELVKAEEKPGSLVKARALALEGSRTYPKSTGGERCRAIVGQIEQPDYRLAAMAADGPGRRSIEVTHRNLGALHFRAYAVDLEERLSLARDYNLLPQGRELDSLVAKSTPAATFHVDLPATPDFKLHRTFVTPPALSRGFYVIVASPRADFSAGQNPLRAVGMLVTDLVLDIRQTDDGGIEARAVSGTTGQPAAGASVALWRYDWQAGHARAATARTSDDGLAAFDPDPDRNGKSHFLFARRGDDLALDPTYLGFWNRPAPAETSSALVYTDRSIYRPLQKVLWKAVVFSGRGDLARWRVVPQTPVTLTLVDANGQAVESKTVASNAYGSAAGEFAIPAGRALGAWSVRCATGGAAPIRVEEYKRPTFETTLEVPKDPLRLNRPATFRGGSRYYFGLPVTNGSVAWRVTREAEYPWWWGWWGGGRPAGAETVAAGKASLAQDGTFAVTFTPKADERAGKDVTYRYRLSADVTDEGGETRSADRTFRLGFVSVKARVEKEKNFFLEGNRAVGNAAPSRGGGAQGDVKIVRTDLDGNPKAGKGTWRLLRLVGPEKALLPAEFPSKKSEGADGSGEPRAALIEGDAKGGSKEFQTPGDLLRPRWSTEYSIAQWLHAWKDGAETASGAVTHDAKGEAKLTLPALPAGAYRLRYATADDFGADYETSEDFLVAGSTVAPALPLVLLAESSSVRVGGVARFHVASGIKGQVLYLDVVRAGKVIERRILRAGADAALIERTITEEDRGGLGVTLTALRDHQFLQQTQAVFVPWDDRELKVTFATFRDRLRPGQTETWRVTVKGATKEHPLAETAELLAYMYDRSLDVFAPHRPPSALSLLPNRATPATWRATLGPAQALWLTSGGFPPPPSWGGLTVDRLKFEDGYGIGGPGRRGGVVGGIAEGRMAQNQAYPASAPMAMKAAAGRGDRAGRGQGREVRREPIPFLRRKTPKGLARTQPATLRRPPSEAISPRPRSGSRTF